MNKIHSQSINLFLIIRINPNILAPDANVEDNCFQENYSIFSVFFNIIIKN